MNLGLLDLPAPLWDAIDAGLAEVGLPAIARVMSYAIGSAWISTATRSRKFPSAAPGASASSSGRGAG